MKTAIFIDGYNLYYGVLKKTRYKWLNLHALFSHILHEQDPASEIVDCCFYTSLTKSKIATRGEKSVQAQQIYHRALVSKYTPPITVIAYNYQLEPKPLVLYEDGKPPDKTRRVMVWALAEKKCDVCLALHAYKAAASGQIEQVVIASNDTDLEPALEAIRDDFPKVRLGVIVPRRLNAGRPASEGLRVRADWMRKHISDDELEKFQFPPRVPTRKKPADKPDYW